MENLILSNCEGFQWDLGNLDKNWEKHKVSNKECEEVFFNKPLIISHDPAHSLEEKRWFALGKTNDNRPLFVVFTLRNNLIRVISARDMNKKERKKYNE
jgi:uncharacterized DUF497 family protein